MAANRIYEVKLGWGNVYAQPSTHSKVERRLGRGKRFTGRPVGEAWVQRLAGGYVRCVSVRDLGERRVTNDQMQEAIDRFSAAAQTLSADLHDATGDLLEAFAARSQQLTTQVAAMLIERLERLERRQELLQRHIEQIDLRLDEAHERAIGE